MDNSLFVPLRDHLKRRGTIGHIVRENGCWEWTGAVNSKGYGNLRITPGSGGQIMDAHRYFYLRSRGKLTPGMVLDHLCRNTVCVNPDHLEEVSQSENLARGAGRTRRQTHCVNGHLYTDDNIYWRRGWRSCRTCRAETNRRLASSGYYANYARAKRAAAKVKV